MASLTGNQVGASYLGIIKTLDNTAITASPKQLSDGAGNALTVCASSSSLIFTGTADFSAATVTGITTTDTTYDLGSAQSASNVNINLTGSDATTDTITLVAGSNVTLTDDGFNNVTIAVAADTDTTYDLASAQAGSDVNVNLTGSDATTDTVKFAAGTNITLTDNGSNQITIDASGGAAGLVNGVGTDSLKNADSLVTNPTIASGNCSIALGDGAKAYANCSIVIGYSACDFDISRVKAIAIGCGAAPAQCGIAIGSNTRAVRDGVTIGSCAIGQSNDSVVIGCGACIPGASCDSIAIGRGSLAQGDYTAAIGNNVTATRSNYITGCAYEACVAGQGLVVTSPDGLTTLGIGIDNSGNIVTYTP